MLGGLRAGLKQKLKGVVEDLKGRRAEPTPEPARAARPVEARPVEARAVEVAPRAAEARPVPAPRPAERPVDVAPRAEEARPVPEVVAHAGESGAVPSASQAVADTAPESVEAVEAAPQALASEAAEGAPESPASENEATEAIASEAAASQAEARQDEASETEASQVKIADAPVTASAPSEAAASQTVASGAIAGQTVASEAGIADAPVTSPSVSKAETLTTSDAVPAITTPSETPPPPAVASPPPPKPEPAVSVAALAKAAAAGQVSAKPMHADTGSTDLDAYIKRARANGRDVASIRGGVGLNRADDGTPYWGPVDNDSSRAKAAGLLLAIDQNECISCGTCVEQTDKVYLLPDDGKATPIAQDGPMDLIQDAIDACPVTCISWVSRDEADERGLATGEG